MLNQFTLDDLHDIVDALATALDAKHSFTLGHSERVADLSLLIARRLGLPASEQEKIHVGAHLHDIGKIGIPDAILNKSGKLNPEEIFAIRQHPSIGDHIVKKVKILLPVADIVRHHHERFDGKGYPDGLSGDEISVGARIVAVADAFDAMTSNRSYRLALSFEEAMREMRHCRGSQFDPDVVDALSILADEKNLNILINNKVG